jgi:hypothetical protein
VLATRCISLRTSRSRSRSRSQGSTNDGCRGRNVLIFAIPDCFNCFCEADSDSVCREHPHLRQPWWQLRERCASSSQTQTEGHARTPRR